MRHDCARQLWKSMATATFRKETTAYQTKAYERISVVDASVADASTVAAITFVVLLLVRSLLPVERPWYCLLAEMLWCFVRFTHRVSFSDTQQQPQPRRACEVNNS